MPPIRISIAATNVSEYRKLAKELRKAGKTDLRKQLRKQIADAGRPVLDDVKAAVRDMPVTSRGGGGAQRRRFNVARASTERAKASAARRGAGLRSTIASATKLQITAKGVRFVVQSSKLPADQRTLPRHLDSEKGWRHPVFGDRDVWVTQKGRPYFGSTIKRKAPAFRKAIVDAMEKIRQQLSR
jgi:hypothetical protein